MNTDIPNSDEIEVILKDIVNKITGTFKLQKIILFGSFANGNPREDSDIDLLVIMESRKRPIERIRDI